MKVFISMLILINGVWTYAPEYDYQVKDIEACEKGVEAGNAYLHDTDLADKYVFYCTIK